jgi:flagellar biosynthetic protein FlhB
MSEEAGERTEAPTAKRKRDAAEKGDVLRSREFGTALVVLAGVCWVVMFGPSLVAACKAVMAASLSFDHRDVEDFAPFRPLQQAGAKLLPALLSLFAIAFVAAILSQAGLGSLSFNGSLLAPKASRINPGSGLSRIFGSNGWVELGKSLLKVVLLGAIGGYMLVKTSRMTLGLAGTDIGTAVGELGGTFNGILIAMAFGLVGIAMLDVPVAIVRLLGKLRMTKQQIRDEHKESEGSPEAKGHIRQKQREMARGGVRKQVATAHVILTNPTHFAVALRYDRDSDRVPVVVAKGRGATALAIRDVAGEAAVPILEYPALARAVYYTSRENQEVRDDLYLAIATVLAFVFGLNAVAGGTPPPIEVPPSARFDEHGEKQA